MREAPAAKGPARQDLEWVAAFVELVFGGSEAEALSQHWEKTGLAHVRVTHNQSRAACVGCYVRYAPERALEPLTTCKRCGRFLLPVPLSMLASRDWKALLSHWRVNADDRLIGAIREYGGALVN